MIKHLPPAQEAIAKRQIGQRVLILWCSGQERAESEALMMKTSYDLEADAMFIWLAPEGAKVAETLEVAPGIILDYDDCGTVIGIEVLDIRGRLTQVIPAAAE